ncbi:MAG: DUF4255 domain-containing protein [Pseudomonadota bacterium]
MSNFLSIAVVSTTLRRLLQDAVQTDVTGATATTVRPDAPATQLPSPGVNIFLYQVTPNTAWVNADLPTRNANGSLVQRPMIALDLHYLLTFYGSDSNLEPQRVLGSAVRTLHAQPIVTADMIQATLDAAAVEDPAHFLLGSNLGNDVERVKFTQLPLSLEELSKLWSVLFQTPYSLSVAYMATVVLLEAEQSAQRALPVRVRSIGVVPFRRAQVDSIIDTDPANPMPDVIEINDEVELQGSQLDGQVSLIRVGEAELQPVADSVRTDRMRLQLIDPDLRAGIQGAQVLYENGSQSNIVALVLRPEVTVDQPAVTATELPIDFDPLVDREQRVTIYLNEQNPPATRAAFAYSFEAPEFNGIADPLVPSTGRIVFAISNVQPASYLVRVQVGGAESVLGTDAGGSYNSPLAVVP